MSLFTFTGTVTVEASSAEDALRTIGAKLTTHARHLGDDVPLAATKPFFSLTEGKKGAIATDLTQDPIADARKAAAAEADVSGNAASDLKGEDN